MPEAKTHRSLPLDYSPATGFAPGFKPHTPDGRAVIRVGSAGNATIGRDPWVAYRYHQVDRDVQELEQDRFLTGDCYIDAETRRRVDPRAVEIEGPSEGRTDPGKNLVPLTRSAILDYLDAAIRSWRRERDGGERAELAPYYIDAYQSVRSSLFGETLS